MFNVGEGKNFYFDLRRAVIFCKTLFREIYTGVAVILGDTPYCHTPFYIRVEVLQVVALLLLQATEL